MPTKAVPYWWNDLSASSPSGAGDVPFFYGDGGTGGGGGGLPLRIPGHGGGGSRHFNRPVAGPTAGGGGSGIPPELLQLLVQAMSQGGNTGTPYGFGGTSDYGTTPGGYLKELQSFYAPTPAPGAAPSPGAPSPSPVAPATSGTPVKGGTPIAAPGTAPTPNDTSSGYPTDGSNGSSSSGGFDFNQFLQTYGPLIGQFLGAGGQYLSNRSNQKSAAGGPVLPKDVQPARDFFGQLLLQMLSTPGGLSAGAPPFPINLGETDPYAAVNKYRESSAPGFTDELNKALDTEKAKLGGQYGIRFGTDLQRGLGDTVTQATNARESELGRLGVSAYDSFMHRRLAELAGRLGDYRSQQNAYLPLVANYLSGQPSSQPYQGGSPFGQALQSLGGGLANAPVFQYVNSLDRR